MCSRPDLKPAPPEPESCTAGYAVGHPIIPATGEKVLQEHDLADASAGGLNLVRHYRSSRVVGAVTGAASAGLGQAWSHNHATVLKQAGATGAVGSNARILFGDGSVRAFTWDAATAAWKPANSSDILSANSTGPLYTRLDDDSHWQFDTAGKLLTLTRRNGWVTAYSYSATGLLIQVSNQFGRTLSFAYDASGRLASATAADGQTVSYGYDTTGRLTSVSYPDSTTGSVTKAYLYENTAFPQLVTGVISETGTRLATYAYDSQGRGISTQYAGGADLYSISYAAGGAAVVTDPLGTQRTFQYATAKGKLAVTGADKPSAGGASDAAHRLQDANGFVTQETDFLGVSTMHTWDINRRLPLSTTQAAGRPEAQTRQTEWHPVFRLPTRITEAGRTTAYNYDNFGNKLSETITDTASGQARTWAWTYNAQGLQDTMTDPKGGVWKYGYDTVGNRTSSTNPLGQQTSYSYDAGGRVISQTEPNGLVTRYSYDARGRLVSQNRGGEVSSYSYTATGQLASATLPNGFQASYSYDAAQRLIAATDNRGNSVHYTLDAAGNRIREEVKDPTGAIALITARVINSLNKVAAIQGSVGQTTALAYDANGEPVSTTDPLNQTTRQTLDGLRRPTATTFPDNTSAQQAWNQLDQLTQVTDPKGVATRYQTNAFGEVMSETSPDIGTIRYTRDANGEVITTEDAKGQISRIERDALGRPTVIEYAQGHSASFSYDAVGHVTRIDDKSGSTRYERDAQGRILGKTQLVNDNPSSPMQLAVSYGYQAGDLASLTYPSGLKVFYRRAAGRITGIEVQEPATRTSTPAIIPFVSDLTHTALGQPRSWRWSNGDAASRTFDTDGRMTHSEIASYSYDAASRITGISQSLWAERTVTAVVNGKPQTTTELYPTPISWTAGYDARNRLTSFTRAGAETKYSYDANSNRLTAIDTTSSEIDLEGSFDQPNFTQSASQSLNVDAASNKLLGFSQTITKTQAGNPVSSVTSNVHYSVDANGAMTSDGLRTFEYDESRRLAKVKIVKDGEAARVEYLHNALGQRVFKSEPQAEQTLPQEEDLGPGFMNWLKKSFGWMFTKGGGAKASLGMAFVYGDSEIPSWALLGEYDNGSALGKGRTEYIWLPTEDGNAIPIGLYKNGKFYAVHSDHLGTPRLITDQDKKPVWQWPYSAFGNNKPAGLLLASTTNGQTTLRATKPIVENNQRFPGQYSDDETGFAYNYFRTYDARVRGGYTQPDPIGLAGGLNRFLYANGSPLLYADHTGLIAGVDDAVVLGGVLIIGGTWWAVNSMSTAGSAANDATYNNVVDLLKKFCEPDDRCKKAEDALLRERLLINGLFFMRLIDMAEYRSRALAFNEKVKSHNRSCPKNQVGELPIGPQKP